MTGIEVVDSHHHLWDTTQLDYELFATIEPLRRPYRLTDYKRELPPNRIAKSVCVEAASAGADGAAETAWLLKEIEGDATVGALVAWAPLDRPDLDTYLDRLRKRAPTRIVGIRRSFEFEPSDFPEGDQVIEGAQIAGDRGLVVELVLFSRSLRSATALVDACPNTQFVLDHLGKPPIRSGEVQPWKDDLAELALRPNVVAKLSGLPTEAAQLSWTREQIAPYVDHALAWFGADRLLYGSDWPLVNLAGGHARWLETVCALIGHLPQRDQAAILGGTARRTYSL